MQEAYEHNAADPFGEFRCTGLQREFHLIGARFEFRSHSAELIALVDTAYAGLPHHLFDAGQPPLRVDLSLIEDDALAGVEEPPVPRMQGGGGLFGAIIDGANFAFAAPAARGATVSISRGLLKRHRYHARYELLEFAVFMLASRAQELVALHAACVGWQGRGALLIGDSGAGKTTLALQCLLEGLEFLTEDASFVEPATLQATGVANFLHPRLDALQFIEPQSRRAQVAASPMIRRRSGVEKLELDLRTCGGLLAAAPQKLAALVFVCAEVARSGPLLRPIAAADAKARMRASQAGAARLGNWTAFEAGFMQLPLLELRRGGHPSEGTAALRGLLTGQ